MLWSKLVTPEATPLQMSAFVVGGLLVTIVGGLIFHIVVEKPLTRFLQQRLIKRKPVSVQSDQPA